MGMDIYLTATPKSEENNLAYLEDNFDVISEIIDVVPYARINTDFLVNKKNLEKILNNLKTKKNHLLSITIRNKSQEKRLKKTKEGIEALQLISDNFDFDKNFLYVYYE